MHTLKPTVPVTLRVYVYHSSGEVYIFESLESFIADLSRLFVLRHFGDEFYQDLGLSTASYVAKDELGRPISRESLLQHKQLAPRPIPFSGRQLGRKRKGYKIHRTIKTLQEQRWADAWNDEEYAPKTRAKRNKTNLPSSWDDIRRRDQRCWKKQRRTQWK